MPRKVPGKTMIAVWIPEELNKSLRDILPAKRGSLSQFIVDAISEKLERDYGVRVYDSH